MVHRSQKQVQYEISYSIVTCFLKKIVVFHNFWRQQLLLFAVNICPSVFTLVCILNCFDFCFVIFIFSSRSPYRLQRISLAFFLATFSWEKVTIPMMWKILSAALPCDSLTLLLCLCLALFHFLGSLLFTGIPGLGIFFTNLSSAT